MHPFWIFLLVVAALFLRGKTREEIAALARQGWTAAGPAREAAARFVLQGDPFVDALRARTGRLHATPALVSTKVVVYVLMVAGAGSSGDPDTLLRWGASVGPETTNGEWWRLATALLGSWGLLQLVADVVPLAQVGALLERLTGSLVVVTVFIAAGVITGVAGLAAHPVDVHAGAAGAILGLYGLLLALVVHGWVRRSDTSIPLATLRRLWPGLAVFLLYNLLAGTVTATVVYIGLGTGLAGALVLTDGFGARRPRIYPVATALGLTIMAVTLVAVPLRGTPDVAAEVQAVAAVEERTAPVYDAAVDRFRRGRLDAEALATLIEERILPELDAAQAQVNGLAKVPADQQALVTGAREYLRLREQSWRERAAGLRLGDLRGLQEADHLKGLALDELRKATAAVGLSS